MVASLSSSIFVAIAASAIGGFTLAQPGQRPSADPKDDRHAAVSLIADRESVEPGGEITVGIAFDIQPKWHIYWNGQNDSGTAPEITWDLPAGWKAGPIEWTAPRRYTQPGDLLDHVYEGKPTLLARLQAPASSKAGEHVTIKASVEYLVCHEACVPESGTGSVRIAIASDVSSQPKPGNARIADARKRVPKPIVERADAIELSWEGSTARLSAPGTKSLAFFPSAESAPVDNLLNNGVSGTGVLKLALQTEGKPASPGLLQGIVEISRDQGQTNWYWLSVRVGESLPKAAAVQKQ